MRLFCVRRRGQSINSKPVERISQIGKRLMGIVTTPIGRFRLVDPGGMSLADSWKFECPGCGTWAYLDADQWAGRVSVDHAAMGCAGDYHATHDFSAAFELAFADRTA
jgi:hypothetical protein